MPPKEETHIGLTPKESHMLSVVVSLMGDIPNVNFEDVARLCGHKYAKNARTSCKKLFEKLKAANPDGSGTTGGTAGLDDAQDSGGDGTTSGHKKRPAPKKRASAQAAPKKAATGMKKRVSQKVKKQESENDAGKFDIGMKGEGNEDQDQSYDQEMGQTGKSKFSASVDEHSFSPFVSTVFGVTATFPPGYKFPADATEDEIYKAHTHEITVEEWWTWKIQNDYDDNRAITPITVHHPNEDEA